MTAPVKVDCPIVRGELVTVEGMPSYGELEVTSTKWSSVSGWYLDARDEDGMTWVIVLRDVLTHRQHGEEV